MDEDGAAASLNAGPRVVVEFDDEIIRVVGAGQPIRIAGGRELDGPIVMAVGGILAPGIVLFDTPRRQQRRRSRVALGAPPQPLKPERAARRAAVAFALVGLDA